MNKSRSKEKGNFFLKSLSEKNSIFEEMKSSYSDWKKEVQNINKPFFPIHTDFKHFFLKDISGGALKLYIYLGFHAKHYTGELWHSSEEIASFFEKDQRTIGSWFKELEEHGLIFREQKGFRMKANTFLRPYGFTFNQLLISKKDISFNITEDIKSNIEKNWSPLFSLVLNYSLKEYTLLIIYKQEELFQCSYIIDFDESELKILRSTLKRNGIRVDNYDSVSSLITAKNKALTLYSLLMKYLDSEKG